MKKSNFLFTALLFALTAMSVDAFAITVSGTVYDAQDGDVLIGANVQALDANDNPIKNLGMQTNGEGQFSLEIPDDAKLRVSYISYQTETIKKPGQNLTIKLQQTRKEIQEVETVACSKDTTAKLNALDAKWDPNKKICVATVCPGPVPSEYDIQQDGSCKKIKCTDEEIDILKKIGNALTTKVEGNGCVIDDCIGEPGEYKKQNNSCTKVKCTDSEKLELQQKYHAKKVTVQDGKCVPADCVDGYRLIGSKCEENKCDKPEEAWDEKEGKCVQVRCSEQQLKDANAIDGTWDKKKNQCDIKCNTDEGLGPVNGKCEKIDCSKTEKEEIKKSAGTDGAKWDEKSKKCVPSKCDESAGFTLNEKQECIQTKCSDKDDKKLKRKNVNNTKWEDGKCIAVDCVSNEYKVNEDKTACVHIKCETAEEDFDKKTGKCVKVRCTDEQKQPIHAEEGKWDEEKDRCVATKCDEKIYTLDATKGICKLKDERSDDEKKKDLEEKQKAYDDAKAKEQSTANKTLTALTTAATGIGGMQLAQGLAEQSADKSATADMAAYIETMRCTYGDGKQVKASAEEIELPGANDQEMMNLRAEYLALAQDLKERKEALGMKSGIESEEILDRASSGLYDDESIGITGGNYASLYRAQMLESEADQAKIDDAASTSKNRVMGGAIAAGAGVVVGAVGNSLINGKLGELLKSKKDKKKLADMSEQEQSDFINNQEKTNEIVEKIKKCLQEKNISKNDQQNMEEMIKQCTK